MIHYITIDVEHRQVQSTFSGTLLKVGVVSSYNFKDFGLLSFNLLTFYFFDIFFKISGLLIS